jgi:class 3 adenylate cyclase
LKRLGPQAFAERLLATRGQVSYERRIVTILFSDVRGSNALAESRDPEDILNVMNGAFEVLIAPLTHCEGALAPLIPVPITTSDTQPWAPLPSWRRVARSS